MRRLGVARRAIAAGTPLAEAAAAAGFADQSHMTRQFGRAYGMTPGRFSALTRA
jgi:AraC-like DNA-binding protein